MVNLEDEAPPQQGNTLATGERLAGYAEKGSARLVGAGTPKACEVDGARAESTQPRRAALLWQAATIKSCLRQKNFVFSMKYALGTMTRRT